MADKMKFDVVIDQAAMDIAADMAQAAINLHIKSGSTVTPQAAAVCVATHMALLVAEKYSLPPAAFIKAFEANLVFAGADMKTDVDAKIVTLKPPAPPGDKKAN